LKRYIKLVKRKYYKKYVKELQNKERELILDRISKYTCFMLSFGESTYNKYKLNYVRKTPNDYEIDKIIGKRLYNMIEEFIENE